MKRGELYRVRAPTRDPKASRVFVVVGRDAVVRAATMQDIICAPVHSQRQGIASEVHVGLREGLNHDSTILCDALRLVPKRELTDLVGELSPLKTLELDRALRVALGLD
jgi:mRNA interferase MazF